MHYEAQFRVGSVVVIAWLRERRDYLTRSWLCPVATVNDWLSQTSPAARCPLLRARRK